MPVGTTYDSNLTRDQLIEQAYKMLGVLEEGETLSAALQSDAILSLNMLVRALSDQDVFLHALSTQTLTLVANTWIYTSANGLPTNLQRLTTVEYRDSSATDWPMEILTREQYEAIPNKLDTGDPQGVFLTDGLMISSRTLSVWPALSSVNTQSVVTGTDAAAYRCIKSHTADSTNHPITGANYLQFWEAGGSGPSAWASGTAYLAPQLLRLTAERPLYDFDAASDNPEIPSSQTLFLKYRLAADLAPNFNLALDRIAYLNQTAEMWFLKTFKKSMQKKTTHRPRAAYF